MLTNPEKLLNRIYEYVKQQGVHRCKYRDEWILKLQNGVEIQVAMEDAGYTHSLYVKGLINAWSDFSHDIVFSNGDKNNLLTVARMIGFQVEY
jgi:hypothetical protein